MKRAPVKDQKTYRKLREKGESNGKAARIANAAAGFSRRTVRAKGGNSPSFEDWNKEQLLRRASEIGIKGRSAPAANTTKKQLAEAAGNH